MSDVPPSLPSNLKPISGGPDDAPRTPPPVKAAAKVAQVKAPRKKSAIDTLVARDQTAVFWFLVACFVGAGCAWYLVIMAEALKARPPFVVMDTSGAYYVAPGMNFDTMEPMHLSLTQLAVETMFDRGPQGLNNPERLGKLFTRNGTTALQDLLKKENAYFVSQKVEQTVELLPESELSQLPSAFFPIAGKSRPKTNPMVMVKLPTAVSTFAVGIVTRRGLFKGQVQVERYWFKVAFAWKMNPNMRGNQAFPSVIEKILVYQLEKISDS
jgi:Na+/alanine symporter